MRLVEGWNLTFEVMSYALGGRARPRIERRGLQMVLRLLAYNGEAWLAEHFNAYLADPGPGTTVATARSTAAGLRTGVRPLANLG